jgi:glyoxylase-like metal-dependent hydrolase (beta-lactamase superfamily II)
VASRPVTAHALTYAHFDHFGSIRAVCNALQIPLWCGADDAAAVQASKMVIRGGRVVPAAPAHQVARALTEGDEVAGFTVLETRATRRGMSPSGAGPTASWCAAT